jgi:eukaryotic-like serine/threonine-protein kinase
VAELSVGQSIGPYECIAPLASGGMASVWIARLVGPQGFQKLVAIKTIHPHLETDTFRRMFLDEARITSRIEHPNVVRVHELGEEQGLLYLAMEYVDGESLQTAAREAFRADGVPLGVTLQIVIDAARGLHAAHELADDEGRPLEVVHRDVAPHNLLLSYTGHTKVVDFGIAKVADRVSDQTSASFRKGRITFMAPEQLSGGNIDRRADVFALGVVLYQLLTSKNPFRRETETATMKSILLDDPAPPSVTARVTVPPSLDAIVLRCLAKEPDDRFSTAAAVANALAATAAEAAVALGTDDVGAWVTTHCGTLGQDRRERVRAALGALEAATPSPRPSSRAPRVAASVPPIAAPPRRARSRTILAASAAAIVVAAATAYVARSSRHTEEAPAPEARHDDAPAEAAEPPPAPTLATAAPPAAPLPKAPAQPRRATTLPHAGTPREAASGHRSAAPAADPLLRSGLK